MRVFWRAEKKIHTIAHTRSPASPRPVKAQPEFIPDSRIQKGTLTRALSPVLSESIRLSTCESRTLVLAPLLFRLNFKLQSTHLIMQAAKLFAVGIAATASVAASSAEFESWAKVHNRVYDSADEHALRAAIFASNKRFVDKHNELHKQGLKTFTTKLNQFADLTNTEYREMILGLKRQAPASAGATATFDMRSAPSPPDSFDARQLGIVNEVKNQASCGEYRDIVLVIFEVPFTYVKSFFTLPACMCTRLHKNTHNRLLLGIFSCCCHGRCVQPQEQWHSRKSMQGQHLWPS